MATLKELHQKMIEQGFKINLQKEIPLNFAKTLTVEQILTQYGDMQAEQPYPAALELIISRRESALIPYSR
jgi:hypothetical protein